MTSIEFMRRKNAIVLHETGVVLVPESQLVDIKCTNLMLATTDATMCPYCIEFASKGREDVSHECEGCPMHEAGNGCKVVYRSSTYQKALTELRLRSNAPLICLTSIPALRMLVSEWNRRLGEDT